MDCNYNKLSYYLGQSIMLTANYLVNMMNSLKVN